MSQNLMYIFHFSDDLFLFNMYYLGSFRPSLKLRMYRGNICVLPKIKCPMDSQSNLLQIIETVRFDTDVVVSVFETNIRIVG